MLISDEAFEKKITKLIKECNKKKESSNIKKTKRPRENKC